MRDWRIYSLDFAHRLIAHARKLYANESLGMELDKHGICSGFQCTIDLRLSLFPWAHFRSTRGGGEDATLLLDLRGNIPSFVHISNGKLHDVHALDLLIPEAGAIYVMDRGYIDFARLYVLHQAGAFSHPCQVEPGCAPRLLGADRSGDRYYCRPDYRIGWLFYQQGLKIPYSILRRVRLRMPHREKAGVSYQTILPCRRH